MWEPWWHKAGYREVVVADGVGGKAGAEDAVSEPRCRCGVRAAHASSGMWVSTKTVLLREGFFFMKSSR